MRTKFARGAATAIGLLVATGRVASAETVSAPQHRPPPPRASTATQADVDRLSATVDALQNRLSIAEDQIRTDRAATEATRAQLAQKPLTLPAEPPGPPDKIYYKGVSITLGGFLEGAGIYRTRNDVSDISSNFSRIPFPNSPLAHTSELRGSARQSRLSLLIQGDINPTTHAAFYSEFDFQAGAQTSNSVESNSYVPRIRHMYGTLDWDDLGLHLLAGQSWSLITLNNNGITPRNELVPPTIDGQYLPGFTWARQPQVRLVKDWDKTFWVALSLENSQSTFSTPATGIQSTASGISVLTSAPGMTDFDAANNFSINHLPDIVGKLAYETRLGEDYPLHLEIYGVWRSFSDRINVSAGNALGLPAGVTNSSADGGGGGAGIIATVIPKWLDIEATVLTGHGIGRYGSGQLPDVTLKPDGQIAPINQTIFLAGGTLHVTPQLDFYVYGGGEYQDSKYFDVAGQHFGFGNPAANLPQAACTTEGGICSGNIRRIHQITAGFWDKLFTGSFGQIRIGAQYSHTELTDFRGSTGFAPATSEDMVFTSFRYYLP